MNFTLQYIEFVKFARNIKKLSSVQIPHSYNTFENKGYKALLPQRYKGG